MIQLFSGVATALERHKIRMRSVLDRGATRVESALGREVTRVETALDSHEKLVSFAGAEGQARDGSCRNWQESTGFRRWRSACPNVEMTR